MLTMLQRYRKTFLTNFLRIHYSQFGEDVALKQLIGRQADGFYVDVGCYHPKKFSNTYFLYRRGWSGINVDMEAHKIELFRLARPRDENVVAAVSDKESTAYIETGRSHDLGARLADTGDEARRVTTRTLTHILDNTRFKGRRIDLLSVDVEGHDLAVLRSLDFAVYRPRFVVVELHETDPRKMLASDLNQFLETKGYRLRSWVICSLIYECSGTGV